MKLFLTLVTAIFCSLAGAAHADTCRYKSVTFGGDGDYIGYAVNGTCSIDYAPSDDSCDRHAIILVHPLHGKLDTSGPCSLTYTADSGFKGDDLFAVGVCKVNPFGSRCSIENYDLTSTDAGDPEIKGTLTITPSNRWQYLDAFQKAARSAAPHWECRTERCPP